MAGMREGEVLMMKKGEISIVIPEHLYLLKGNPNPFGPWGGSAHRGR